MSYIIEYFISGLNGKLNKYCGFMPGNICLDRSLISTCPFILHKHSSLPRILPRWLLIVFTFLSAHLTSPVNLLEMLRIISSPVALSQPGTKSPSAASDVTASRVQTTPGGQCVGRSGRHGLRGGGGYAHHVNLTAGLCGHLLRCPAVLWVTHRAPRETWER